MLKTDVVEFRPDTKICVWPCGVIICEEEEVESYLQWMGDDYEVIDIVWNEDGGYTDIKGQIYG